MAFVGAGGKTTALFRAAREIVATGGWDGEKETRTVLVTTSTHLGAWQASLADHKYQINNLRDLQMLEEHLPGGVVLVSGKENGARLSGLEEEMLNELWRMAQEHQLPLLIEADGARGRPLKAPAENEPAIPEYAQQVIVVAGLAGLGQPLSKGWMHREEIFTELTGLQPGERITGEALVKELLHAEGGLKHIPCDARHDVLLNQADTPELRSQAQAIARQLLPQYDACVIASLSKNNEEVTSIVKQERETVSEIYSVIEPIAGIILAAGGSSRFGQPKQLLTWKGQALIRCVAQTALKAGVRPVIAVLGANACEVHAAIEDLPLRIVNITDWEKGVSSTIKAGIKSLPVNVGGVVFFQADQPQIPPTLVNRLVEAHQSSLKAIVAPKIDGQRGNPVLFDQCVFQQLLSLEGDLGGRALLAHFPVEWVSWPDRRLLVDIDTPQDYQNLIAMYSQDEEQA
jgi:molybdenum cofactor cytidylyltransferase